MNTLDAVGATPTASTLSGVFDLEIFASKTIDASKRLARFEPARSQISAGALFEYGTKTGAGIPVIQDGALFQLKKDTVSLANPKLNTVNLGRLPNSR